MTVPGDSASGPMCDDDRAALALLEVGPHEPRADAVGGRDGVPHLLGGAGQLDRELHAQRDVGGGHRCLLRLLGRSGMGGDDQPVGPAVVVVVAGGEIEHRGGELVGERGAVLGGAEPDLGVDGQRRQALAGRVGAAGEAADLAHDAAGEGDEVPRGEAIRAPARGRTPDASSAAGETT